MKYTIYFFCLPPSICPVPIHHIPKPPSPPPSSEGFDSIPHAAFQQIIDSSLVKGAVLIYDPQKNTYYSNDFDWAKTGHLPASTFKIPNSIIALETGVVENDSTLFKWDGKKRALAIWEKDMILHEAFHRSCVPCYQEIARKIGVARMKAHLRKFDYGYMLVDSSNLDIFWLEGASRINQFQQIDFLSRFTATKVTYFRTYRPDHQTHDAHGGN